MPTSTRANTLLRLGRKITRNLIPYGRKFRILCSVRDELMSAFSRRRALLASRGRRDRGNLVIILFPANPFLISGGIFSLLNIAATSREVLCDDYEVIVSYPPDTTGLACYPYFPNKELIFNFTHIIRMYPNPQSIIIHIPEFLANSVFKNIDARETQYLLSAKSLRINILNQNILLMPPREDLKHLTALCGEISQTTAHITYCTQYNSDRWNSPMLHLSAPIWKEFPQVPYSLKHDWITYSPDPNPHTAAVLNTIHRHFPHFKLIKINGVSYQRYLEIISQSKYVISFGEGFDAYFFDSYHCGTIGCTSRNNIFFPSDMKDLPMLYRSFDDMELNIIDDIKYFESNIDNYLSHINQQRKEFLSELDICWTYYNTKLENFYSKKFDYVPYA